MSLLESILGAANGGAVQQLGQQFGLDQNQTTSALQQLLPALTGGLQNNLQQQGGLEGLMNALQSGNHGRFLEDPSLLGAAETTSEGNGILGHLLGSKDASRALASQASATTGIGADVLKQMLPVVATMVMGGLSQRSSQLSSAGAGQGDLMSMLTPMLDSNRDGSVADDVMGMLGKFLSK
jgi:hypothetical protein